MIRIFYPIITCALLFFAFLYGDETLPSFDALKSPIEKLMKDLDIPGVVGIAKHNDPYFVKNGYPL